MKEPGFTPQRPTQEQHREGHWSYEELKQHILAAYPTGEGSSIKFDALPKSLDLGRMGTKTLECVRRMNEDPRHREHGASIIYDPSKKSLIMHRDEQIIIGTEDRIAPVGNLFIDEAGNYSEIAALIHTHPDESSFSSRDIISLLDGGLNIDMYSQIYILGNVDFSITALLASSDTIRKSNHQNLIARHNQILEQAYAQISKKKSGSFQLPTHDEELHVQHIALAKLAEEYKLGYYRGDQSGILRRFRVKKPAQE